jgi:hypothetical protein
MKHGHLERSWQDGHSTGGHLEAVKELASPSGEYMAVISRGAGSSLRVCVYQHFYDEFVDECYWSQVTGASLADGIQTAENIAKEELCRASGENISI